MARSSPCLAADEVAGQLEVAVMLRQLLQHVQQHPGGGRADRCAHVVVRGVTAQRTVEIDPLKVVVQLLPYAAYPGGELVDGSRPDELGVAVASDLNALH